MDNLSIYPLFLFMMALLAIISGFGALWTIRNRRDGWLTTVIWVVFSSSISTGFITFGLFTYMTRGNEIVAIGIGGLGMAAVILVSALASM